MKEYMEVYMGTASDNAQIIEKTSNLAASIRILADGLPDQVSHNLKGRLNYTAQNLPKTIEETLNQEGGRISKIRRYIRAGGALQECRDYLNLVRVLRYGSTKGLVDQLNDVNTMLKNYCDVDNDYTQDAVA